jgi:uncharacterized repeat protein (TIGR03803 family)
MFKTNILVNRPPSIASPDQVGPRRRAVIAYLKYSLAFAMLQAFLLASAPNLAAQTETVLYTFTGQTDGSLPNAPLVADEDGNLYGTANFGGNLKECDDQGCGTVFELLKSGKFKVLYAFSGGTDGSVPNGPLLRNAQGNLYGTAQEGGAHNQGVVFKITPSGTEIVLYSFGSLADDGSLPMAGLVMDSAGNLYGTTFAGGGNCPGYGCGTVFEVTPSGTEKVLWRFGHVKNDGLNPYYTTLVRDTNGNLYGTTHYGGANPGPDGTGLGTVFVVTSSGEEHVLYSFTSEADGAFPYAGLVQDPEGHLFGTTGGTVFEITAAGEEKTIYQFPGFPGDGYDCTANLLRAANGDLYGTTFQGGTYDGGAVFGLTSSGVEILLYSFYTTGSGLEAVDGQWPTGGLIQDAAGNLYGATTYGGDYDTALLCENEGCGVLFKVTP